MEFGQMLSELGLEEHAEVLQPGWEESVQSLPAGALPFLTEPYLAAAAELFSVSSEGLALALSVAGKIDANPALRALTWHYHRVVYGVPQARWNRLRNWPLPERALGEQARVLCSLVLLSGLPRMHEEHRAHDVPEAVIRDTLDDIRLGLGTPADSHHQGTSPHMVGWFSNFVRGELYRLGRLQFQLGNFGYRVRAFRHRASGAVLALSEEGVRYDAQGQVASDDAEGAWEATLEISDAGATGYPILPEGRTLAQPVTLAAAEWTQVLRPADAALHIHIPGRGGQPMAFDRCGDSFRQALEFFPRHYPEHHFRAFCCESWVLNTWFQRALSASSNMSRFQREVYLFPVGLTTEELIHTAFNWHTPEDISQAPRNTHLQRAVAEVIEAGGQPEVTGGGCFLLPEDVRWGEQVYLRQGLPIALGSGTGSPQPDAS